MSTITGCVVLAHDAVVGVEAVPVKAMGAMALLPICDTSFTCEDYNTFRAHPWSPFLLRRAHPGPGPHTSPRRGSWCQSHPRAGRQCSSGASRRARPPVSQKPAVPKFQNATFLGIQPHVKSLRSSYTGLHPQIRSSYTWLYPQNVSFHNVLFVQNRVRVMGLSVADLRKKQDVYLEFASHQCSSVASHHARWPVYRRPTVGFRI